jgi:hypothetical protein
MFDTPVSKRMSPVYNISGPTRQPQVYGNLTAHISLHRRTPTLGRTPHDSEAGQRQRVCLVRCFL